MASQGWRERNRKWQCREVQETSHGDVWLPNNVYALITWTHWTDLNPLKRSISYDMYLFSKWTTYPAVFMPLPFPETHLESCARTPRAKSTLPELDLGRLASPSQLATLLRPSNRWPFLWPSSQFSIYLSCAAVGTHNSWAVNYEPRRKNRC